MGGSGQRGQNTHIFLRKTGKFSRIAPGPGVPTEKGRLEMKARELTELITQLARSVAFFSPSPEPRHLHL